jgi:hypothetical protein
MIDNVGSQAECFFTLLHLYHYIVGYMKTSAFKRVDSFMLFLHCETVAVTAFYSVITI